MAQYKTGTVTISAGSLNIVTGTGTTWLTEVTVGDIFNITGVLVPYFVASVDSDTQITLSAPYGGGAVTNGSYAISRDFTSILGLPYPTSGDVDTPLLIKRAFSILDGGVSVTGLNYTGAYNSVTVYAMEDAVYYNGTCYISLVDGNTGNTPPDPTAAPDSFWDVVARKGDIGLVWQSAWLTATAYSFADGVSHNGSSYYCIQAHTSGSTTEPGVGASWTTYWNVLASKGDQGIQGEKGMNWKGDWVSTTAYVLDDGVASGGASYICIQANTNQVPPNAVYWDLMASPGEITYSAITEAVGNINDTIVNMPLKTGIDGQYTGVCKFTNATAAGASSLFDRYGIGHLTTAVDEPRFGNYGIITDPLSTNSILWNGDYSNVAWSGTAAIGTPITAAGHPMDLLTDADNLSSLSKFQTVAITNDSNTHAISVLVKQSGTDNLSCIQIALTGGTTTTADRFDIDFTTKTATQSLTQAATLLGVEEKSDGVLRLLMNVTNNSSGNTGLVFYSLPAGNGGVASIGSCYFGRPQVELNRTHPTNIIPTTSAAVTRQADLALWDGDNCPNINKDFTVISDVYTFADGIAIVGQFLNIQNSAGTDAAFYFRRIHSSGQLSVTIVDDVSSKALALGTGQMNAYSNIRVGATFSRSTNTLTLYINGIAITSRSDISTISQFLPSKFKLAGWSADTNVGAVDGMEFSNIKLYQRCLTAAEMRIA